MSTSCLLCVCEEPYCFLLSWRGTSSFKFFSGKRDDLGP